MTNDKLNEFYCEEVLKKCVHKPVAYSPDGTNNDRTMRVRCKREGCNLDMEGSLFLKGNHPRILKRKYYGPDYVSDPAVIRTELVNLLQSTPYVLNYNFGEFRFKEGYGWWWKDVAVHENLGNAVMLALKAKKEKENG